MTQTAHTSNCNELHLLDEVVFKTCGFALSNVIEEVESREYAASTFQLDGRNVKFRVAKITPAKVGQFVTIWKRNKEGITEPCSISDDIDFYIIVTRSKDGVGAFLFPKKTLHEKGVLSGGKSAGKRGIRVYPAWDVTGNKQAQGSQKWQVEYFVDLTSPGKMALEKVKDILS